jgi:hypothetical protein
MSLLLWPLKMLWALVVAIVALTGRLVAIALGLALIFVGVVLSLTVVGAVVGIPLLLFGLALIARGLF